MAAPYSGAARAVPLYAINNRSGAGPVGDGRKTMIAEMRLQLVARRLERDRKARNRAACTRCDAPGVAHRAEDAVLPGYAGTGGAAVDIYRDRL